MEKKVFTIICVVITFCIFELGISAHCTASEKDKGVTLTVALFHSHADPGSKIWKSYEGIFDYVTGGKIKIKVFPAGTLVKGPAHLDGVQRNMCDLAFQWAPYLGQTYPMADMTITPGIWRDIKGAQEAYNNGIKDIIQEEYEAHGLNNVIVIDTLQFGGRYLLTKKPVKAPRDLKGLKMRTTGAAEVAFFKLCGAGTAATSISESYESLLRGVIDGAPGTLANFYNEKWAEVAKYLLDFSLAQNTMLLIGSKRSLDGIPQELRPTVNILLKSCMREIELSRIIESSYYRETWLPKMGIVFYRPNEVETKEWMEICDKVKIEWINRAGERGKRALEIAKKYNGE